MIILVQKVRGRWSLICPPFRWAWTWRHLNFVSKFFFVNWILWPNQAVEPHKNWYYNYKYQVHLPKMSIRLHIESRLQNMFSLEVCLGFQLIYPNTHAWRLSSCLNLVLCELDSLIHYWPTHAVEPHRICIIIISICWLT